MRILLALSIVLSILLVCGCAKPDQGASETPASNTGGTAPPRGSGGGGGAGGSAAGFNPNGPRWHAGEFIGPHSKPAVVYRQRLRESKQKEAAAKKAAANSPKTNAKTGKPTTSSAAGSS